jgi:1-acyl-sn-glycerol-3-phosphate acyltransferase
MEGEKGAMRYRKGAPLISESPWSRLVGDILVAFVALIGWPLSRLLYSIKIENTNSRSGLTHRLPSRAILLSNHCMPLDPVFHGLAVFPRRTYFTLLEETCEAPVLGSLVRLLGGIPLPRSSGRLKDIEDAVAYGLSTRGLVHFYPEGECFIGNQRIFPFKAGACYFAIRFGVPIVPIVSILKRRHGKKSRRTQVTVHVLAPVAPPPPPPEKNPHAFLIRSIQFSRQIHDLMQAEIEREGGDHSLYRGPMPRIKGVND